MLRILIVATVALAASASAGMLDAGTVGNKFMVTYNIVPDPLHAFSFYSMPRTINDAIEDDFAQWDANDADSTTLWCRNNDYRVCVLFDKQGSVAGIQLSVKVSEMAKSKTPLDMLAIPEWRQQRIYGEDVYSATAYFQSKAELQAGGRPMSEDTLTAPDGLYLLQTDKDGVETGRLHVSNAEAEAESVGFNEQSCFFGMGKHYFQNMRKDSTCLGHRPYFLLFGPKTKKMQGFGFFQYGKSSQGRGWLENPSAVVAKTIAPNSPDCMPKWINKYGLFTMHVFFVEKPYYTRC